jgi:multidrug efflux pump subunit AcrB
MLCIVAVFIPAFFMTGAARALFVPLSLAVGFSMLASYLLSSTLVPVLSIWLLRSGKHPDQDTDKASRGSAFARFQSRYTRLAAGTVRLRWIILPVYLGIMALIILLAGRRPGVEIFPAIDLGQLALRIRAPAGTKVETTEQIALKVLELVRREVGSNHVSTTMGLIGVHAPNYPINLIYLFNGGPEEGWLAIQFAPSIAMKMAGLKERLRSVFAAELPDVRVSFEPSDIVNRVMSFGASTPIEVAVSGPNLMVNREHAQKIYDRLMQRMSNSSRPSIFQRWISTSTGNERDCLG